MKCPKCSYERKAGDLAPPTECPECGVIYAKYRQAQARARAAAPKKQEPKKNRLIQCGGCGHDVSRNAQACPRCGEPIAAQAESAGSGVQLNTIQETSKKLKLHTLLAVGMMMMGFIWFMVAAQAPESGTLIIPMLLIPAGFFWYIVNRFRIWWHHK